MHDSANMQRCSINRSVQGEFWAIASQAGLLRKLHPTTQTNSGPRFPDGASRGNCVPLWSARTGCAFRLRSLAETASRNRHSDWDAFSRSRPSGKLRPGICVRNGTRFPQGPNQPPAPRQNHPLSSVACGTSKEFPKVPALKERPQLPAVIRRNSKSPRR